MKKIITAAAAGCLGFALSPIAFVMPKSAMLSNPKDENPPNVQDSMSKQPGLHFVIRDSAQDPLPPDVKNTQVIPAGKDPQDLPNFSYTTINVITKMPYYDDKENLTYAESLT